MLITSVLFDGRVLCAFIQKEKSTDHLTCAFLFLCKDFILV